VSPSPLKLYVGYMDTDMVRDVTSEKSDPADIARIAGGVSAASNCSTGSFRSLDRTMAAPTTQPATDINFKAPG